MSIAQQAPHPYPTVPMSVQCRLPSCLLLNGLYKVRRAQRAITPRLFRPNEAELQAMLPTHTDK